MFWHLPLYTHHLLPHLARMSRLAFVDWIFCSLYAKFILEFTINYQNFPEPMSIWFIARLVNQVSIPYLSSSGIGYRGRITDCGRHKIAKTILSRLCKERKVTIIGDSFSSLPWLGYCILYYSSCLQMFNLQRVASVLGRSVYRSFSSTSAPSPAVASSRLVVGTISTEGQTINADGTKKVESAAAAVGQPKSKSKCTE